MPQETATRSFAMADQAAFAALSGDRNPMHMDPTAARRTQAGECAVHGMHALLWGLEALSSGGLALDGMADLKVEFARFIRLGAPITATLRGRTPTRAQAELLQDAQRAVAIHLTLGPRAPRDGPPPSEPIPIPTIPADPPLESLAGAGGHLLAPDLAPETLFPRTVAALGRGTVASLSLLSTLVGMVAPGLNSIFSGFQLGFGDSGVAAGLAYRVTRVDPRFRLVGIEVAGPGFAGTLRAFARLPPVATPPLAAIEQAAVPEEFAGRRALVIGGSRGLGAVTAKLIAAGGGRVALTYLRGQVEAEAIAREIEGRFGPGRCRTLRYDTAADPGPQLAALTEPLTHAYYFATGRIFGPATTVTFDPARLAAFTEVYVTGFHRLAAHLLARWPENELVLFYPSSVAVETRPRGITEYAMAKAAGEILCADLAQAHRRLRITAPRLPRIMTDQTATVPPVPAADPVETMLALLRAE